MLVTTVSRMINDAFAKRNARRQNEVEWARLIASDARLGKELGKYDVALHFADKPVNLYQPRQWYGPLEELDKTHPTVIIARRMASAIALRKESPVDVIFAPKIEMVEDFLRDQDVKLMLYVNQFSRNMVMMRFSSIMHIFLSHGESDKTYMASGQNRAFDFSFIAGQAAASRLSSIMNYDVANRTRQIGRPQLDIPPTAPTELPQTTRKTVLYAPTWEGDRPSMRYGSIQSHGSQILKALIASGRYRVIVRTHPRSGLFVDEYRAAVTQAKAIVEEAIALDPSAGHMWDTTDNMDWQFDVSDVCITDVSAVAVDWLPTLRPLVITKPVEAKAEISAGMMDDLDLLSAEQAASIPQILDGLLADDMASETLRPWAEHYFGDTTQGAQMSRWLAACDDIIRMRDQMLRELESAAEDTSTSIEPVSASGPGASNV